MKIRASTVAAAVVAFVVISTISPFRLLNLAYLVVGIAIGLAVPRRDK